MPSLRLHHEREYLQGLDSFFATYPKAAVHERAMKLIRFTMVSGESMGGEPEGWAAGAVYEAFNRGRWPCGVPGIFNRDFEKFFGVTMSTVRTRAAQIQRASEL